MWSIIILYSPADTTLRKLQEPTGQGNTNGESPQYQ